MKVSEIKREIAEWLLDRLKVGKNEEVGSIDSTTFTNINDKEFEVIIAKEENGYGVYRPYTMMPMFTLNEDNTLNEIEMKLSCVELNEF